MKTAYIASPYDGTLCVYEASIPLSLNKITDFCKGDTATISVDEGYNYLWSDGSTQNFMTTTTPGEHTVQVTDDTGRKGADTTSVVFHDPPEFMLLKEEWNSNDNTSLINAFSYDYTSPFTYLWNDGSTSQSIIVSNPDSLNPKKEFSVTVTDKYGCYNSESISLIYTALHDDYLKNDDGISIFPNPFNENIHFDIQKPNYGNLKVRVSNLEEKNC
ncbi:MAG: hypothetical protein IPF54_08885 [Draconibacterium sp.]|nr:hypothetical protein [Draconibacterium sp.]